MKYEYSRGEAQERDMLAELKKVLRRDLNVFRQGLDLANCQMRNVDRCEDAWIAEVLFRRGIPLDEIHMVDFGSEYMEVFDDQPK